MSFLKKNGIKKIVFCTFSKLFWSYVGSVWAFFFVLKGPLCVYFLLQRSINNLENLDFKNLTKTFNVLGYLLTFRDVKVIHIFWQKTMPKPFSSNSKTTLKKSRNRLFWPPKWSKMTPQIGQNEQIFGRKFWFSKSFMNLWSWKYTQKWAFWDRKQCINTS